MKRPPMWLWAVVIALGAGVAFADLRAEWRIADCAPRVFAEVPR